MERPYQYAALAPRHIRLLKVTQDPDIRRIQFEFIPVSLDDLPCAYTAVSYLWGSAAKTRRVWQGDEYVEVTASAMAILESMASRTDPSYVWMAAETADQDIEPERAAFAAGPPYIWIDALCIDQENMVERAAQVRLMRDVFASATKVLAWLQYLPEYAGVLDFVAAVSGVMFDLEEQKQPLNLQTLDAHPVTRDMASWDRLANLLRNPWFTRIWVIQEVVIPKNVELKCGPDAMPWTILADLLMLLRQDNLLLLVTEVEDGQVMSSPPGIQSLFRTWAIRTLFHNAVPCTLASLLIDFWSCGASDGRDKLFALIGLATDADDPAFEPDYTISQNAVFERLTARLLTRDTGSTLMLHAAGTGFSDRDENLPTWVADWAAPFRNAVLADSNGRVYTAGGNTEGACDIIHDPEKHTLELSGHIIDSIQWLAETTPPAAWYDTREGLRDFMADQLARIEQVRAQYPENRYPGSSNDFYPAVLSHLLIADVVVPSGEVPSDCVDHFEAYISRADWACRVTAQEWDAYNNYETHQEDGKVAAASRYITDMSVARSRRLFVTEKRYAGMGFSGVEVGDQICVFRGFSTPFILRRGDNGAYRLVGECYVYGLMDGEGLDMSPEERITLI